MNNNSKKISEADLHAFVDGRLDPDREQAVESYLLQHPAKAGEVAAWQQQNETLKALYGHVLNEPVPERLRPTVIAPNKTGWASNKTKRAAGSFAWPAIAAALAIFVLGGAVGWYGRDLASPTQLAAITLANEAITAHSIYAVEVRHPVEVAANDQKHLVGWLSKRLGEQISAPDLSAKGFNLIGGRLLPAAKGPAAQFMYENDKGRRVTLYVTRNRSNQLAAFQFSKKADYNAFYWLDATISYALVGDVPRSELKQLAIKAYNQLTL